MWINEYNGIISVTTDDSVEYKVDCEYVVNIHTNEYILEICEVNGIEVDSLQESFVNWIKMLTYKELTRWG